MSDIKETSFWEAWAPQSILSLRDYNSRRLFQDLVAGITVGLVALPLAMAFSISSGLPPQNGIYCAVVSGFLISLLGGTRRQIGGPTGAFVVVVAGILAKYGLDGLYVCTMMAGVMLVLLGATGFGAAVKFIPRPIVVGFTNGIAVLIASTQIKDFFGLHLQKTPSDFLPRMAMLASNMHTLSLPTTLLSCGALALLILGMRYAKRAPGPIIVLAIGILLVVLLKLPVETIGTRFGGIPSGLPRFQVPSFHPYLVPQLIAPALTVAMLGAIESLMSAVVADRMSGDRHNPNVELVAQGIANIASPLVGGLPATGAIARTATNIRSGAQTPVAGMVHALTLLGILLFAAPLARFIPLGVLAAILFIVAYNMGEWREIPQLLKLSKADIAVWTVTFALTVFADLTLAVEVGMILAALVFIRKVTQTTTVTEVTSDDIDDGRLHVLQDKQIPEYVTIFRIHGPFLFGATDKIQEIEERIEQLAPIVLLRLRNMTAIDATGLRALEDLAEKLNESGRTLILCGARQQPARLLRQSELERRIGAGNICENVSKALQRADEVYRRLEVPKREEQVLQAS